MRCETKCGSHATARLKRIAGSNSPFLWGVAALGTELIGLLFQCVLNIKGKAGLEDDAKHYCLNLSHLIKLIASALRCRNFGKIDT